MTWLGDIDLYGKHILKIFFVIAQLISLLLVQEFYSARDYFEIISNFLPRTMLLKNPTFFAGCFVSHCYVMCVLCVVLVFFFFFFFFFFLVSFLGYVL